MEKEKATQLFGTAEEPTELASKVCHLPGVPSKVPSCFLTDNFSFRQIMGVKSSRFDVGAPTGSGIATAAGSGSKLSRIKFSDAERKRLEERIKTATSLELTPRLCSLMWLLR